MLKNTKLYPVMNSGNISCGLCQHTVDSAVNMSGFFKQIISEYNNYSEVNMIISNQ